MHASTLLKIIFCALSSISLFLLSHNQGKNFQFSRRTIAMGTIITLQADGETAQLAINEALKKIAELEKKIDADTAKIADTNTFVEVNPEVYEMIKLSMDYSLITNGAFDITIGAATELWNFNAAEPSLPSAEKINSAKKFVGFKHLNLQDSSHSVKSDLIGVKINLGAVAKGYAADIVKDIFRRHGIQSGIINFGNSTIFVFGKKTIGLQNPRKPESIMTAIEIENSAISTSGDYMKYFILQGKRYHHILDPKTCMPVDNGVCAVSVIVDEKIEHCSAIADILSTAIFVLGHDIDEKDQRQTSDGYHIAEHTVKITTSADLSATNRYFYR